MIDIIYSDNGIQKGKVKDIDKLLDKKLWIDITNITVEDKAILTENLKLHPLTIEDIFSSHTRIKVESFDEYLFCVFYGIKKNKKIDMNEIDFVLSKNFIITNHKKELLSISNLKKDNQRLEKIFSRGLDFIFQKLLDEEIDNFFPVLEYIDDTLVDIQNKVIKNANPKILSEILEMKRQLSLIKKVTLQQREKASFLAKNEYSFISKKAIPYFRDIYDHTIRVHDSIDNSREASANSFDVYMSIVSNNMNEVMKVLSIIATIALPLTVISGIYGTNFDALPGQHFTYGFWAMILLMFLMASGMIFYFRKKNWF